MREALGFRVYYAGSTVHRNTMPVSTSKELPGIVGKPILARLRNSPFEIAVGMLSSDLTGVKLALFMKVGL